MVWPLVDAVLDVSEEAAVRIRSWEDPGHGSRHPPCVFQV